MYSRFIIVIYLLAITLPAGSYGQTANGTAETAGHRIDSMAFVTLLERQLIAAERVGLECHTQAYESINGAPEKLVEIEDVKAVFDFVGRRGRLSRVTTRPASSSVGPFRSETLLTPERRVEFELDAAGKADVIAFDEEVSTDEWNDALGSSTVGCLFGYIPLSDIESYLPDLLRSLEVVIQTDPEGRLMARGTSPNLEFRLVLDRDSGLIREVTYSRPTKAVAPGVPTEFNCRVLSTQSIDGTVFPAKVEMRTIRPGGKAVPGPRGGLGPQIFTPESIPSRTLTRICEVQSLQRLTADELSSAMEIDVPDGVRAYAINAPHLKFEHKGGTFIPVGAAAADALARRAEFREEASRWRVWLLWINVAVIVAILAIFLARARKKSSPG